MLTRLVMVLVLMSAAATVHALDESIFEDEDAGGRQFRATPGSEWKELDIPLPEYPRSENLVELDVSDYNFPFAVFIDKTSVSVAKDRIVRYTVVVRSASGADNVSYEGIQCRQHRVKRYAFGSGGRLVPTTDPEWRYIRPNRQDSYRRLLAGGIFCPLPMGDTEREIGVRLQENSLSTGVYPGDVE